VVSLLNNYSHKKTAAWCLSIDNVGKEVYREINVHITRKANLLIPCVSPLTL